MFKNQEKFCDHKKKYEQITTKLSRIGPESMIRKIAENWYKKNLPCLGKIEITNASELIKCLSTDV